MSRYRITRLKIFELIRFCAEKKIEMNLTHAGPIGVEGWLEESGANQIKAAGFWIEAY